MIFLIRKPGQDSDKIYCLVNIPAVKADALAGEGWDVFRLGLAHPTLMPGVLAAIDAIDPKFVQNMEPLRVVTTIEPTETKDET